MRQIMSHPFKKCFKRLEVKMIKGANILCASQEHGVVTIFVEVDTKEKEMETRNFLIMNSGESFVEGNGVLINKIYINHVMTSDGIRFLYEQL